MRVEPSVGLQEHQTPEEVHEALALAGARPEAGHHHLVITVTDHLVPRLLLTPYLAGQDWGSAFSQLSTGTGPLGPSATATRNLASLSAGRCSSSATESTSIPRKVRQGAGPTLGCQRHSQVSALGGQDIQRLVAFG